MTISGVVQCRSAGKIFFTIVKIIQTRALRSRSLKWVSVRYLKDGISFPNVTVRENLDMGAFIEMTEQKSKDDLDYVFDSLFPILNGEGNQDGGTLSGGEQQMLAMSRALMARPQLMLLDEPSMGLAPLVIKQIFQIIKKINSESDTTIFLVEQNANQALQIADRGYVIENGVITMTGSAKSLLSNQDIQKAYLGI
jgi:branched-chain amino acid transport system ATP-binding protein